MYTLQVHCCSVFCVIILYFVYIVSNILPVCVCDVCCACVEWCSVPSANMIGKAPMLNIMNTMMRSFLSSLPLFVRNKCYHSENKTLESIITDCENL